MEIKRPKSEQPIPDHAKKVFSGILFDVYQWEQEQFDGSKAIYEKIKRPDTAYIYPILPDGRILLAEQGQPGKDPFIGALGGRVEEGEEVLMAVKRELLEESGYEAEHFLLWNSHQPTSKIEWAVYTFIAKGLHKIKEQELDAGEKIILKPVTLDEFIEIGVQDNFIEKEMVRKLIEAKYSPEKKAELQELFDPNS